VDLEALMGVPVDWRISDLNDAALVEAAEADSPLSRELADRFSQMLQLYEPNEEWSYAEQAEMLATVETELEEVKLELEEAKRELKKHTA